MFCTNQNENKKFEKMSWVQYKCIHKSVQEKTKDFSRQLNKIALH